MKTAQVLRDIQKAWKEAAQSFQQGNYAGAVGCYQKALALCQSLPTDAKVDRCRFEASCHAGLSASFGRAGKHLEGFAAANKALVFYDACGDKYPADVGRWLMAQVNQGTALAAMGCFDAAVEALLKAKEIFVRHGLDMTDNKQWLEMVDGNIAAIAAHRKKKEQHPS